MQNIEHVKTIVTSSEFTIPEKEKGVKVLVNALKEDGVSLISKRKISNFLKGCLRDDSDISDVVKSLVSKYYFRLALEGFSDVRAEVLKCSKSESSNFDYPGFVVVEALKVASALAMKKDYDACRVVLRCAKSYRYDAVADYSKAQVVEALKASARLAVKGDAKAVRVILAFSDFESDDSPNDEDMQLLAVRLLRLLASNGNSKAIAKLKSLCYQFSNGEIPDLRKSVRLAIIDSYQDLLKAA